MADQQTLAGAGPLRLHQGLATAHDRPGGAPLPDDAEKTIVVRDRRKPNQYTTDNLIAREWLPILRVGDAFFFYSVYLSMANRDTESSWGSLRTQAEYLQCSVDLIVRGNKLLEICELVHIETGNQYTSNEYYILDPPPLSPDLKARIQRRLDEIARQETSKNWQAWVRQVRKALGRHRSLTGIWAERRARRGGRPVKAVRPDELLDPQGAEADDPGVCDSQPPLRLPAKGNGNGDRGSQPGRSWDTDSAHVGHRQGGRAPRPEQGVLTRDHQEGKERKPLSPAFVREWLAALGVSEVAIQALEERYPTQRILRQLEWLRYRNPRDPAAMLVRAVQDDWEAPHEAPTGSELAAGRVEAPVEPALDQAPETGSADEDEDEPDVDEAVVEMRRAWAQLLVELRMQMTQVTFDHWLNGTEVVDVQEDVVSVLARNEYAAQWLEGRWDLPLSRTLSGIVGRPLSIRYLSPDREP